MILLNTFAVLSSIVIFTFLPVQVYFLRTKKNSTKIYEILNSGDINDFLLIYFVKQNIDNVVYEEVIDDLHVTIQMAKPAKRLKQV